jgi:DNA polymerase (family 10)
MTSDEIIETLELHAKLLELHGENAFKIKAFSNAAYKLNKLRYDFDGRSKEDIDKIEGIGKSISKFIYELIQHGSAQEHDELIEKTPPGVGDMLGIKGLGPKKVNAIWKELGIESVGELLYACNENRLAGLKGFGEKTQEAVKTSIEFKLQNTSKRHYAAVETLVNETIHALQIKHPHIQLSSVGDLRRKREIIDHIEILSDEDLTEELKGLEIQVGVPLKLHVCAKQEFTSELFRLTSTEKHLQQSGFNKLEKQHFSSEEAIYKALDMQYIEPELREGLHEVDLAKHHKIPVLIEDKDLKGILHNHTTYSDGINTLKEMADYCHKLGYEYLGICDHSKSAFYANGLNEDKVWEQRMEIEALKF